MPKPTGLRTVSYAASGPSEGIPDEHQKSHHEFCMCSRDQTLNARGTGMYQTQAPTYHQKVLMTIQMKQKHFRSTTTVNQVSQ